jgi:hypothetical protein
MNNKTKAEAINDAVSLHRYNESKGKKVIGGKKVYRKITAIESKTFGTELRFQIPRVGKLMLKNCFLRVDLPSLSGTGGSYIRFVNYILPYLFERFQLWSAGRLVMEKYSDEIVANLIPNIGYAKWIKVAADIGANDSTSGRNTLAASTQNLVLDMKYVFDIFAKAFGIALLSDEQNAIELRCIIQSNQNKVIQSDHSSISTLTITDVFLECIYQENHLIHNSIAESHSKMVKETGGIGHTIMVHDSVRRNVPVAASGSLTQDCDIRAFHNLKLTNVTFLVRDSVDLSTANAYDYTDDLKSVTSFQLKDGSVNLFLKESQVTDTEYRRMVLPQYEHKGIDRIYARNQYIVSFSEDQDDEYGKIKSYEGAWSTHGITDLRLNLELASTTTAKTIDILATALKPLAIVGGALKLLN